jgi:PTH1 family peptidyl-tRNA hydrolase
MKSIFHRTQRSRGTVTKLIVGLGNPGPEYSQNRHNIGFACLNRLAKCLGITFDRKEGLARTAHGMIDEMTVVLARPQTFMNRSGLAVSKLLEKYRLTPSDLTVIHDDLDLRIGQVRVRQGGRSAGHRGIDSIIAELNTQDFVRVRVGIGRPTVSDSVDKQEAVIDYVLDDFSPEEYKQIEVSITRVVEVVKTVIIGGVDEAMNSFNSPARIPPHDTNQP